MEEANDQLYCKQCLVPIGTSVNCTTVSQAGFFLYELEMQKLPGLKPDISNRLLHEWML